MIGFTGSEDLLPFGEFFHLRRNSSIKKATENRSLPPEVTLDWQRFWVYTLFKRQGVILMQLQIKKWGNGTGIRFTKEFLRRAGIQLNDTLNAEIINGQIVLTPEFRHRSLRERAAAYGGQLNLSDEMEREEPCGSEVW